MSADRPYRSLSIIVACVLGACGGDDPVAVVRAFDRASEMGSRSEVFSMLGPTTKARLQKDALRASELSGRRGLRPEELLAIAWSPRRFHAQKPRLRFCVGNQAEVEVRGEHGATEVLTLVRIDGAWRIEL